MFTRRGSVELGSLLLARHMLEQYVFMLCPHPIRLGRAITYGLWGLRSKTVLPAQLDLLQIQQHENMLYFGALVEISLMKNMLDLILHKLVIYCRAMEVKETCSLHLFNKEEERLHTVTVLPAQGVWHTDQDWKIKRHIKNTNIFFWQI